MSDTKDETSPVLPTRTGPGFGKRINQLTAEDMRWWHKHSFTPKVGGTYRCLRANKEGSTIKGKVYLYEGGALHHYGKRDHTLLLGGYNLLRQRYDFEVENACPFCAKPVFADATGAKVIHDILLCEEADRDKKK